MVGMDRYQIVSSSYFYVIFMYNIYISFCLLNYLHAFIILYALFFNYIEILKYYIDVFVIFNFFFYLI